MEVDGKWMISSRKHSLRISSQENNSQTLNGLPLDVEIFQNLIDNICRKFDTSNGENIICFGGCAIYNSDGSLKSVESFVPKYASFLKNWFLLNQRLKDCFLQSNKENVLKEKDILETVNNVVLDTGEQLDCSEDEHSLLKVVKIPNLVKTFESGDFKTSHSISELNICQDKTKPSPKRPRNYKFKIKAGIPVPHRPVLSLNQDEMEEWFPHFIEKLTNKKFPTSTPKKCPEWDDDVDRVLSLKEFSDLGPRPELDWSRVSSNFIWKLKLVAAILLDKKGVDYSTFADNVEEKHEKYSIDDLKLMSMSKNPETFEKLFVKKQTSSKTDTPSYINEFEKKSSEIILQNFRLINARDKKLNGNHKAVLNRRSSESMKRSKSSEQSVPIIEESTSLAVIPETSFMNGITLTPLIGDADFIVKNKRKKSSESSKEESGSKQPHQRFLCKNNFQKNDFLIHPSQVNGKYGPVKLVTYRRETKKVFLCVSDFETIESENDNFVIMEKSSHKSRSTPAKFLDSYIKINHLIEVLDKKSVKMRIKRMIPSKETESTTSTDESSPDMKEELIDFDDLVNDEAFEEELDDPDHSEMVIDESKS